MISFAIFGIKWGQFSYSPSVNFRKFPVIPEKFPGLSHQFQRFVFEKQILRPSLFKFLSISPKFGPKNFPKNTKLINFRTFWGKIF